MQGETHSIYVSPIINHQFSQSNQKCSNQQSATNYDDSKQKSANTYICTMSEINNTGDQSVNAKNQNSAKKQVQCVKINQCEKCAVSEYLNCVCDQPSPEYMSGEDEFCVKSVYCDQIINQDETLINPHLGEDELCIISVYSGENKNQQNLTNNQVQKSNQVQEESVLQVNHTVNKNQPNMCASHNEYQSVLNAKNLSENGDSFVYSVPNISAIHDNNQNNLKHGLTGSNCSENIIDPNSVSKAMDNPTNSTHVYTHRTNPDQNLDTSYSTIDSDSVFDFMSYLQDIELYGQNIESVDIQHDTGEPTKSSRLPFTTTKFINKVVKVTSYMEHALLVKLTMALSPNKNMILPCFYSTKTQLNMKKIKPIKGDPSVQKQMK